MKKLKFFLMVIFLFAGCENFKDIEVGKEGAACFGNGTCREGLECVDGKCVKPDEAQNDDDTGDTGDTGNTGDTEDTGVLVGILIGFFAELKLYRFFAFSRDLMWNWRGFPDF